MVEDERTVASALRRGLRAEGYDVDVADNGDDGLWMALEGSYDIVILDIMLPGKNGYEVCRELRDGGSSVPVLMLTAKSGEYDQAEGGSTPTGADDYLTKPFSFVVLTARIRALLRRGTAINDGTLRVGDLRVDRHAHRCWRGEEAVELSAREMAVLEFLMRRAGSVTTKSEILDNVWDYGFEGDPNIVEVYIGRLRKKIDDPFGARSITTVRGVGYRLESDT